jgi:hypothetical protein
MSYKPKYRYYNGRPYRMSDTGYGTKSQAQHFAKELRKIGYLVRVVKVGKWWKLFTAEMALRRRRRKK